MSIYKACDIRGKFGPELRVEHAVQLGRALADLKGRGSVLVAGDGRLSTPELKSALIESLLGSGCAVVDLGTVPTPLFYFARRHLGFDVGVIVTASHNPAGDNGFKLTLGPLPVTQADMDLIEARMEAGEGAPKGNPTRGSYARVDLFTEYHDFLAPQIPDLRGMRVVIDCASGMAGLVARAAWEKTSAEITLLSEEVDGRFPAHAPNPAEAKNLALLAEEVLRHKADLGVAYDGDADRVAFVAENGQPLTGDQAIVLFARESLKAGPGVVVYDQKCSRIVPDAVREAGGTPLMEPSGHTFIKRAFLERQAVYAGELSGHHFLRAAGGDDALVASFFFARMVKECGQPLSCVAGAIPTYPITPDLRLPMPAKEITHLIERLETGLRDEAALLRTDGLRIEYPHGWALVRPSVTEPVVTMRFEGVDLAALSRIIDRIEEVAPELRGRLPKVL